MTQEPQNHQQEQAELEKQIRRFKRSAGILVVIGVAAAGWGIYKSSSNLGELGSFLQGGTGSAFGLAGLILIYVAFLGQKQQVLIQNEQLADQRRQFEAEQKAQVEQGRQQEEQLKAQQQQFAQQLNSIKLQNFESAFFQLLNVHHANVSHLRMTVERFASASANDEYTGRDCFRVWMNLLRSHYTAKAKAEEQHKDPKFVAGCYMDFYAKYGDNVGYYFRTLYHIFKFVNLSGFQYEDQRRYTSLARAQLSTSELLLLFYNCLSPEGEKFKDLVETFGLLENLHDRDKLLLNPVHEKFYDPKAFK